MSEYKMAVKKVELPSFDGEDPVGWITRAETYFEVQNSSEEVKVKLAKLSMEGATIHWFNLLRETEDHLIWEKLKCALIERYGGRQCDNPFEELKDLTQNGTVDEYISEFECISLQVGKLPEEQYLGYFVVGLHHDICLKVRTFNPKNRVQAMRLARDVEAELFGKIVPRSTPQGGSQQKKGKDWEIGSNSKGEMGQVKVRVKIKKTRGRFIGKDRKDDVQKGTKRMRGTKYLPYAELIERKAKGLCFRCNERYHPLHQCSKKQLRMIILGDNEKVNEEGEIIAIEAGREENGRAMECNMMVLLVCGKHVQVYTVLNK